MKLRHSVLAAALAFAMSGAVFAGTASMSANEAEALLERSGYIDVSGLEYKNGLWLGSATNPAGEVVDVSINPVDNTVSLVGARTTVVTTTTTEPAPVRMVSDPTVVVVDPPALRTPIIVEERVLVPAGRVINRNDVSIVLAANGYHDIHDIDYLNTKNVWKAEARDRTGDDREIHLDPVNGTILHVEED